MKKVIILIPTYNDWESIQKILSEINSVINTINKFEFECIIINDCSTNKKPQINKPIHAGKVRVLKIILALF